MNENQIYTSTVSDNSHLNELYDLARDFDAQGFASVPVQTISRLLNQYLATEDIDEPRLEIANIVCSATEIICFLIGVHEILEKCRE